MSFCWGPISSCWSCSKNKYESRYIWNHNYSHSFQTVVIDTAVICDGTVRITCILRWTLLWSSRYPDMICVKISSLDFDRNRSYEARSICKFHVSGDTLRNDAAMTLSYNVVADWRMICWYQSFLPFQIWLDFEFASFHLLYSTHWRNDVLFLS